MNALPSPRDGQDRLFACLRFALLDFARTEPGVGDERILDAHERRTLAAFSAAEDARRYQLSHLFLRRTLGQWLDREPGELRFERTALEKPYLTDGSGTGHFSLSHSRRYCAVGWHPRLPVGVDAEDHPRFDWAEVAQGVMTEDELQQIEAREPNERWAGFLDFWTAKEALLKAAGLGLSVPMMDLSLQQTGDGLTVLDVPGRLAPPRRWRLRAFAIDAGTRGHIALDTADNA